ncbi:MAG: Gfo/Idh/MocA family oxidoreductase [Candidatus Methanomethylicaceae archaeon]
MRVGVIGLGNMGRHHVRVYKELGCDIVGVVDINERLTNDIARLYGTKLSTDYKDLLKEGVEGVSIAVPTSLHFEVASFFLNNGIHCLVEKPLTRTLDEGRALVKISRRSGAKLMVGHIERFNPAVQKMKEIISQGLLGKPLIINIRRVGPVAPRIVDTGIILDLATHDIDVTRYLYGREPKDVYSKFGSIKYALEDHAIILLDFNGGIASIEVNWLTPHKVRTAVITGTEGIAYMDYIDQSIVIYSSDWKMEPKIEKAEPLKLEITEFISSIKEGREPLVNGEEGLKNLEVALRCLSLTN